MSDLTSRMEDTNSRRHNIVGVCQALGKDNERGYCDEGSLGVIADLNPVFGVKAHLNHTELKGQRSEFRKKDKKEG